MNTPARSYRLASLDLASPFDDHPQALAVPSEVAAGFDAALALVEGGYRQPTSVCRFVQATGLLGVQLADELPPMLRVEVILRSDLIADERWDQRAERMAEGRIVRGLPADDIELHANRRHRLVAVQLQSRLRAQVLLALGEGPEAATRHRLSIDVPTEEIESGLLLIGFGAAAGDSPWALSPSLSDPIVGIGVRRIGVATPGEPTPVSISTGARAEAGWYPYDPRIGYAVLNPPGEAGVRVELRRPSSTGTASRIAGRLARMRAEAPRVEVATLDGNPIAVQVRAEGGLFAFDVPAGTGPVHLRVVQDAGQPWSLRGAVAD